MGISTTNNKAVVYDRMGGWYIRDWYNYSFASAAIDPDTSRVYLGSYDGKIYLMDDGYSYEGDVYNCMFETGLETFGNYVDGKTTTERCYASILTSEATDITFSYILKNRRGYINSNERAIRFEPIQSFYNEDFYDQSLFDTTLPQELKLDIEGAFNELSVQVSLNEVDVDFKIEEIVLEAEVPLY
jgi:hypothetical protein